MYFFFFSLFYFVFEGKFQVQAPRGAYIPRGDLTEGLLRYDFGGLIFGGAYTWRGLFSEFYGIRLVKNQQRVKNEQDPLLGMRQYQRVSTDREIVGLKGMILLSK